MYKTILGITLIVFALAIAIVPAFTDCQSQGKAITLANGSQIPMKCHWTGRAEIAVGAPLAAVGIMLPFSRRKSSFYALGTLAVVLGAATILVPDSLIGVCSTGMPCHTVMKPTLNVLGGLTIVGGLTGLVLARRSQS